jgi:hypothetical protein
MKITYCLVGANQKPAPDRRTDGAQTGMELINFRGAASCCARYQKRSRSSQFVTPSKPQYHGE